MCLRSAIRAGDINWETGIVASFHRLNGTPERAPGDPERLNDGWSLAHEAFHQSLVASCDSPWLLRLRAILYAQSERYWRLSVPLAEAKRDIRREHQEIVDATLERDAERAVALLSNHVEMTTSILLRSAWADSTLPA